MLTTEPLDTANIVDVPADLSTPFDYLTISDTDADNADLGSARRWTWCCKDPACPKMSPSSTGHPREYPERLRQFEHAHNDPI